MKKSDAAPSGRITLRQIARAARVSLMTVSYALRDRPEVSAAERARVQQIARKLGYRPDPLLTHLMQHLRSHRKVKTTANLAVLTTLDANFVRRLLEGASVRAERLGYHLDRIDLKPFLDNPRSLTRMLQSRGVSGVLLAPASDPASYRTLLDWSQFASVAMTYSIFEPHVHRVVTHHFDNALTAFSLLREKGFRRIGLAMTGDMEWRANHSYSGAYFRLAHDGLTTFPALLLDQPSPKAIRQWFSRHKPEAVVATNANHLTEIIRPCLTARDCKRVAFICLDHDRTHPISGIDQIFETIGSHAIDGLVAQLHRNERGLPANPTVTMVEGRWTDTWGLYPFKSA